jgi:predicted Zn-dependent protease
VSESDETQASPPQAIEDNAAAAVTLEVSLGGDAPAAGPDTLHLRRPAPGTVIAEVEIFRLVARPQRPHSLDVLEPAGPPGGLALDDGPLAEAELCLARGDTERARIVAGELEGEPQGAAGELSDDEAGARGLAVRAHLMDGDMEAARALMGRARGDDRLSLADAALALAEGDVALAKERAHAALARRPRGVAEHYTLALIHVALGEVDEAMAQLGRVAASVPEHAVARHQLGHLTLAAGDAARAGTLFEMAIQLAPSFIPPFLSLAEMLVDSRQYAEAMNLLGSVTARLPNALSPRLVQLRVLIEVGDRSAAAILAEGLKGAAPDHPEVTALWAEAMLLAQRGDDAEHELERLLPAAAGEERARLLRMLSRVALQRSPPRARDAVEHLREAASVSLAPGETRLELAQLLLSLGEDHDAIAVLEEIATDARSELGDLLSGAVMGRNHALWGSARRLGEVARGRVLRSSAEGQIDAFLAALPVLD